MVAGPATHGIDIVKGAGDFSCNYAAIGWADWWLYPGFFGRAGVGYANHAVPGYQGGQVRLG